MKKLLAALLMLCLLGAAALAEEAPAAVLDWTAVDAETQALGYDQVLEIPDVASIAYWIPSVLEAIDLTGVEMEIPPVAAYQTSDAAYVMTITALNVTGLEEYLQALADEGAANFNYIVTNGINCVSCVNEENSLDIVIVPVTDTIVLTYAFTPLNGDDDWDQTKAVIVASIRVAE